MSARHDPPFLLVMQTLQQERIFFVFLPQELCHRRPYNPFLLSAPLNYVRAGVSNSCRCAPTEPPANISAPTVEKTACAIMKNRREPRIA